MPLLFEEVPCMLHPEDKAMPTPSRVDLLPEGGTVAVESEDLEDHDVLPPLHAPREQDAATVTLGRDKTKQ